MIGRLLLDSLTPGALFLSSCAAIRAENLLLRRGGAVPGAPEARGVEAPESFAAVFLRAGIKAYLGTTWQVGDRAAAQFAGDVYARLAHGQDVEQAERESRNKLRRNRNRDWGDYVLYGECGFRLVVS